MAAPPRLRIAGVCRPSALLGASLLAAWMLAGVPAQAAAIRGEAVATVEDGFVRIVFQLDAPNDAEVRTAGGILVVAFKRPVAIAVDQLAGMAPGYVTVARQDPDGQAVRLGLAQKVTVQATAVGERFYVDLLPAAWLGPPPALPREAVEELTQRVRAAERKLLQASPGAASEARRSWPAVKIRVATGPTFTRYVFDLPDRVSVTSERSDGRMALTFDAPLAFDLADARAALPPTVAAIGADTEAMKAVARFDFIGRVDVRTFREGGAFVMDVIPLDARPAPAAAADNMPAQPPRSVAPVPDGAGAEGAVPAPPPPLSPPPPPRAAAPAPAVPQAAAKLPPEFDDSVPPYRASEAAPAEPAAAPVPAAQAARQAQAPAPIVARLNRQADAVQLAFPFREATPAAVFRRADTLWLVFDSAAPIDVAQIRGGAPDTVGDIDVTPSGNGQVVRLRLRRSRLSSIAADGPTWIVALGDTVLEPTAALALERNEGARRTTASISLDHPATLHRVADPDIGDKLLVVTALGPARGFLRGQDFVEFRTLPSTHGVVVQPLADDLAVVLDAHDVVLSRPAGLTLTASAEGSGEASARIFDPRAWEASQRADFLAQQSSLVGAAAAAPPERRSMARLDLARFYLTRAFYPEARAVLDVTLSDAAVADDVKAAALVLRGIAAILSGDGQAAMQDLSDPIVGNAHHAPLWRAVAHARAGHWAEAMEGLRTVEAASAGLPVEFQRIVLYEAARASLAVGDVAGAARRLNEFDGIGVPADMRSALAVLNGRVAEAMGRTGDALAAYRMARDDGQGAMSAQGALRAIALRVASQLLARLYGEEGRYHESFQAVHMMQAAFANTDLTRAAQEAAGALFEAVFLDGRGDALAPLDALALFYDSSSLTPIGRRGDEMIRRLAERLIAVDLLPQAAALLQHQVDNRLQGVARAQVATRLAAVYLMDQKPDRALRVLRGTQVGEMPNEWRSQRLMLEARALAETGRHEIAQEVIARLQGPEVERLRVDIDWSARKWRAAAERLERLYAERRHEAAPLDDGERADILRAAVGYALAGETLSLDRLRQQYSARMGAAAERRIFDVVTSPPHGRGEEFPQIVGAAVSADAFRAFLRDLRARYADGGAGRPAPPPPPRS